MNTPFPFDGMLVFAYLSALLLAGVALRARIGLICLVNGPLWWGWSVWVTVAVFAAVMAASLTLMRVMGFWGGKKTHRRID